jgi:hypothetical protein
MADNPLQGMAQRRQRAKRQELEESRTYQLDHAEQVSRLSDEELIGQAPGFPGPHHEMEMNRRLKVAIERLTGELVTFRKSADAAASKLSRLTNVLIGFTAVLVVLTILIAAEK